MTGAPWSGAPVIALSNAGGDTINAINRPGNSTWAAAATSA